MDRRKFIIGTGSLTAAAGSAAVAVTKAGGTSRADGLAKAAGSTSTVAAAASTRKVEGFVLGYLQGSATMVDDPPVTPRTAPKWAAWTAAMTPPPASLRRAFGRESAFNVTIGAMEHGVGSSLLPVLGVEIVAHFATAESNFVPFYAWNYKRTSATRVAASQALSFDAFAPDRMALQVNYTVDEKVVRRDVKLSGMIYLPVVSTGGAGAGIYVLAGPSRITGAPPAVAGYKYSGDPMYPIVSLRNGEPDFDYLTITIAPA